MIRDLSFFYSTYDDVTKVIVFNNCSMGDDCSVAKECTNFSDDRTIVYSVPRDLRAVGLERGRPGGFRSPRGCYRKYIATIHS